MMPDANMEASLSALVTAGLGSSVQRCMAIIFVGGSKSWYYTYSLLVLHDGFVWFC